MMAHKAGLAPAIATTLCVAGAPAAWADHWDDVAPEEVGMSSERLERLTDAMQAYVDEGQVAGLVVLIAKEGQVPYHESFGYRDLEAQDPMETDDIFRIASQTKAIVSTGIMALQEEGLLLVDDPVGRHMPEWMETTVAVDNETGGVDIVPAERPITIRDLLTHTSGIPYGAWINPLTSEAWAEAGIDGWYFASEDEPIREIVRRMADLPMVAQPGTEWLYGSNTDILGALIEVASGQPLDVFLEERFFGPLGMEDTHFFLPAEEADRLAVVYDLSPEGELAPAADAGAMWDQGDYVAGEGPGVTLSGGAGLLSTAHDYATFLEMLRRGGTAPSGERILAPMSVQQMTTDQTGGIEYEPGAGFSYGFQVALDQGAIGTPGNDGEFRWGGAYHTTYWVDPEEDLVVTYFSQFGDVELDDHRKLRALVYQAIVE